MIACLALAVIPMLIALGSAQVTGRREPAAIALAGETWRHQQKLADEGITFERFTPISHGTPQYDIAPGATWLQMLGYNVFGGGALSNQELIYDARLVSLLFGLFAIAGVFWAGYSIGGLLPAVVSALVCVATPMFIYQARLATAQMPMLGLSIFAIAAALWAIRPLRPSANLVRQGIGWALCGIAIALATLTGGPLALPPLLITLAVLVLVCPHRIGHLMGLAAAICIAALLITPWAVYVHKHDPNAWRIWTAVMVPSGWSHPAAYGQLIGWRLGLILAAILPWSLWLIGGLIQPFSTSSSGVRGRMFLGWAWFITVAVLLLAAPGGGSISEVLAVIPAAAIVVGQLFNQYVQRSAAGRHAHFWQWARWVYAWLILLGSAAIPALIQFQPSLLREGYLDQAVLAPMPWFYAAGALIVLSALGLLGFRYAARHYPGRAIGVWAVWVVAATTIITIPLVGHGIWPTPAKGKPILVMNSHIAPGLPGEGVILANHET